MYREPVAARAEFARLEATRGTEHAARALVERPEAFGTLQTAPDGLNEARARVHARLAAALAIQVREAEHGRFPSKEQLLGKELQATEADYRRAEAHAARVRSEMLGLPHRSELEQRVRTGLRALAPREMNQLRLVTTAPQLALAYKVRAAVRDVVLGRDEGLER